MRQRWKKKAMITVVCSLIRREKRGRGKGRDKMKLVIYELCFKHVLSICQRIEWKRLEPEGASWTERWGTVSMCPRDLIWPEIFKAMLRLSTEERHHPEGLVRCVKEGVHFPLSQFFSILAVPHTRGASEIYSDPILRDLNCWTWGRSWRSDFQC